MVEYREANTDDIDILTQMRVSMLCDGTDYTEDFKVKLLNNTRQYILHGFKNNYFIAWIAIKIARL